nr:response regulator transcription factor [Mahella sp.]
MKVVNILAKKILIIDDERIMVKGLKFSLEQDGYETDAAYDGEEGLNKALNEHYDLIILDIMLPKINGLEVCRQVREQSSVPIIMLTAKGDDMDKILGLEYGADDYLAKPFNILELKARVKAIFRRLDLANPKKNDKYLKIKNLTINFENRTVLVDGRDANLTAKEFDLLEVLVTGRGKIFSREQLLETVWKYDYLGDLRTVDVHIRRLREKLEKNPSQPELIFTKWGVGYYFAQE